MLVVAPLAYASAKNDEPDIKKEMEATQQNQTFGTSAGLRSALVISAMYDRQPKWMLT